MRRIARFAIREALRIDRLAEQTGLSEVQLTERRGRLQICATVFPRKLDHQDLPGWLAASTTDGTNALNPRNVITLFRQARNNELEVCDRDDPDYIPGRPLIPTAEIYRALRQLSVTRFEDTVLAENEDLREPLRALRGKPARMSRERLATVLRRSGPEFDVILDKLLYSGVLGAGSTLRYVTVPELYRYSLRSTVQRHPDERELDREEFERIRAAADSAAQKALDSGENQFLYDHDDAERYAALEYIRGNYPELKASEVRGRPDGFRVVKIRLAAGRPDDAELDGIGLAEIQKARDEVAAARNVAATEMRPVFSEFYEYELGRYLTTWLGRDRVTDNIGWTAHLAYPGSQARVQIASDVPGGRIAQQEANISSDPELLSLVDAYVQAACDEVTRARCTADLRPMGALVVAHAKAAIDNREDVFCTIARRKDDWTILRILPR